MLVGLIANSIGLILVSTLLGGGDDFVTVIKAATGEGFLGKLISQRYEWLDWNIGWEAPQANHLSLQPGASS